MCMNIVISCTDISNPVDNINIYLHVFNFQHAIGCRKRIRKFKLLRSKPKKYSIEISIVLKLSKFHENRQLYRTYNVSRFPNEFF